MIRLAIIFLFSVFGLYRAFYPSLHGDESLYVGAAQHILSGDIFLSDYWFDKPFLGPFLIAIGILLTGPHAFGFHLAGFLASIASSFIFISWIKDVLGKEISKYTSYILQILSLLVFLSPFMIFYHASAFLEPFLLFFLLLSGRSLYANMNPARAYKNFTLAILSKQSPMWAPFLVGYWFLQYGLNGIKYGLKEFWQQTKYLWFLGLFFTLTTPEKLAPISLFSKFLSKKSGPVSHLNFGDRFLEWMQTFNSLFVYSFLSWGLFFLVLISSYFILKDSLRNRNSKNFFLIFLPFWIHLLGLILSGITVSDRYVYILIPQLLLLIVAGFTYVEKHSINLFRFLNLYSIILSLFFLSIFNFHSLDLFIKKHLPSREWGRELYQIAEELPKNSVIHNDKLLWYLQPYADSSIRNSCDDKSCYESEQIGRFPYFKQYRLLSEDSGESSYLRQVYIRNLSQKTYDINLEKLLSEEHLRRSLRLGPWVKSFEIELAEKLSEKNSENFFWHKIPSQKIILKITTKFPPWFVQSFDLDGELTINQGSKAELYAGKDRWVLGLRLHHDLIPFLYKGYFIPLGPIDAPAHVHTHSMLSAMTIENLQSKKVRVSFLKNFSDY